MIENGKRAQTPLHCFHILQEGSPAWLRAHSLEPLLECAACRDSDCFTRARGKLAGQKLRFPILDAKGHSKVR